MTQGLTLRSSTCVPVGTYVMPLWRIVYSSSFVVCATYSLRWGGQDNERPEIASIQFYKLYLDSTIRRQFADYDALAVMEWNVIVAHDRRCVGLPVNPAVFVHLFCVRCSGLVICRCMLNVWLGCLAWSPSRLAQTQCGVS